ncbi:hypothetical protein EZV62_028137 [Acer yangbiense]|uniref:Uncharacterized protein n=1 Tax=Acer yangbiense TaxID=1000413 RepID=A0A5C7GPC1_9ROSI|nr:hypothetical protein EZV62_028137 [Acer yangbiense]
MHKNLPKEKSILHGNISSRGHQRRNCIFDNLIRIYRIISKKTLTANDEHDPAGHQGLLKGTRIIVPGQETIRKRKAVAASLPRMIHLSYTSNFIRI